MTEEEVLKEIFDTYKWWVGYCTRSYSSILKHRYYTTTLSQPVIDSIIKHCGYSIIREREYKKN
jgi:hypothetical protein